jgi:GT2 family glycosyltransferase
MLERHPDAAAAAIPYIEPLNRRSLSNRRDPFRAEPGDALRSYVGCSHAVRREIILALGGYREFFVHQREERDLCMRLYGAGYWVVRADSAPIVHMVSPKRENDRVIWYGSRNQILCETLNTPFPDVLSRMPRTLAGLLAYRFSWSKLPLKLGAVGSALVETLLRWNERTPISRADYARFRAMPGHGALEWNADIPPPCGIAEQE